MVFRGKFKSEVESRTQGSKPRPRTQKHPRPRPRTTPPRTDPFEAKDTSASVLQKKKIFKKIFQAISNNKKKQRKRSSKNFSGVLQQKKPSKIVFRAICKISTIQKKVLSSSQGQGNFRRLEASRPRPRTSKCVLEAKEVLEDSISGSNAQYKQKHKKT